MAAAIYVFTLLYIVLVLPWMLARQPSNAPAATGGPAGGNRSQARFTSARERRLWLWTLVVLVAIYSTLGLVAELVEVLRTNNLLRVTSLALFVVVAVPTAARWVQTRPGSREIAVVLGVLAVYLTAFGRASLAGRTHLIEYGLVAILIHQALLERRRNGRRVWAPAVLAWGATGLLGWLDEGIQSLIPSRVYDPVDVLFNSVAALLAITASVVLSWARRRDLIGAFRARAR